MSDTIGAHQDLHSEQGARAANTAAGRPIR